MKAHRLLQFLSGVSALTLATAAAAQTSAPAPAEEVVVTGSRVIKNGNNSPTPVTVVSIDQLTDLKPGNIAEAVSELPNLNGSRVSTSNAGTGVTNAGANHLNLRSLGIPRSLVQFDGARVPPGTYDQLVDITMIPQMMLQRVDIVTGGVSAVYGSDAITGVVNFVTDKNFNGLKVNLEGGESTYGDDRTWSVGVAAGRRILNDKGHLELSFEHHDDPGILYRTDRQNGRDYWAMTGDGCLIGNTLAACVPFHLIKDARNSTATYGGLIAGATGTGALGGGGTIASLNGQMFATNGALSPFVHGVASGSTGWESGGSGAVDDGSLKALLQTNQFFGRFDYEFSDSVHGFVEGVYNNNHSQNWAQYNKLANLIFSGTNPYLPTQYQFSGTFKLSEFLENAPRVTTNSQQIQSLILAGLDGKFGDGYRWNVTYEHSAAQSTTRDDNNWNNQKLLAALDVVKDSTGAIVCRSLAQNPGCVPMNVFGPTAYSAAAVAYVTQPSQFVVANGMDDVSASVAGAPLKLWAGPVNMAVSFEYRNQTLKVDSNTLPTDLATCAGISLNCTQGTTTLWRDATSARLPQVSNSVEEVAYELDAPVLKDQPFAKDVSINGAVRYTNYKTSGSVWTWKVGTVWQANDEFKIRSTRSRDIRAPSLYDLYQPQSVNTNATVTDQLTNITGIATTHSGGNPNLTPETADTVSAGFVYQPSWLPRFSFSVDAYDINITNAISSQNGTLAIPQGTCYSSRGTSLYCTLQTRPLGNYTNSTPANTATDWYTATINVSSLRGYGADFEASYSREVLGNLLSMRALVTWQPHFVLTTAGSAPVDNAGLSAGVGAGAGAPRVRGNITVDYKIGAFDMAVTERWRSELKSDPTNGAVYSFGGSLHPQGYTDLNFKYRLTKDRLGAADLYLNIQNVLNTPPQPYAGNPQLGMTGIFNGFPIGDDAIGRYFTFGVRFRH